MGREIRMVPPNWEHPTKDHYNPFTRTVEKRFFPLYDQPYSEAIKEWVEEYLLWEAGKHPDQDAKYSCYADYAGDAPSQDYYLPDWPAGSRTWWQAYENTSEGTPVTPPFATREELVEYLVTYGDSWTADGGRRPDVKPWDRQPTEAFVRLNWMPSAIYLSR